MLAIEDKLKAGVQREKRQENQQTRPKYDVYMYSEMNSREFVRSIYAEEFSHHYDSHSHNSDPFFTIFKVIYVYSISYDRKRYLHLYCPFELKTCKKSSKKTA